MAFCNMCLSLEILFSQVQYFFLFSSSIIFCCLDKYFNTFYGIYTVQINYLIDTGHKATKFIIFTLLSKRLLQKYINLFNIILLLLIIFSNVGKCETVLV